MDIKNFLINIFKVLIQSIIWIYKLLIQFIKFIDLKMNNFFIGIIENETSKNILRLVQFAILIIIFVFCINYFNNPISKENGYGPWGDFFGGVLNPILTFLTFMGLLITIIIQKKELKESRDVFKGQQEALEKQQEEMTIQSFDNKFFQMLNSFNKTVDSLNLIMNGRTYIGKNVFEQLIKELTNRIKNCNKNTKKLNKADCLKDIFIDFNDNYDTTFKYYFLNLYQLLVFIDEEIPHSDEKKYSKKYTNIVRAQLSKNELILLTYNAVGVIDFCGDNYKKLIEKYSLLEHLTYEAYVKNNEDCISVINSILTIYIEDEQHNAFGKNKLIIEKIKTIKDDIVSDNKSPRDIIEGLA